MDTVKSAVVAPDAPSSTVAGAIEITATSSSTIVARPEPSRMDASVAPFSDRLNTSETPSSTKSPRTVTVTACDVSPGENVRRPDVPS